MDDKVSEESEFAGPWITRKEITSKKAKLLLNGLHNGFSKVSDIKITDQELATFGPNINEMFQEINDVCISRLSDIDLTKKERSNEFGKRVKIERVVTQIKICREKL
ncbi:hypothetical protein RCL_jg8407.t1 [Rhizophagus clarus]|uniref:Uncharacterized protein n=1 Tax=Rhizophagus clarus TaxID=94130 RepID=A0A8H3R534_9GLOM|nr:hypothetical protein RCL_jg8407.t1 [Rhizophagus clarus]